MKYLIDVHTHTLASGHAYSTLLENVKCACEKGLEIMGVSDHGPAMVNGPGPIYFQNFRVIPREIYGVQILRGIEANIMDFDGRLDMPCDKLGKLDFVIVSFHEQCIVPGSREQNTEALLKVMDNKHVDILGHLGNPVYEIDIQAVVNKAKEKNVLIEINNSSFGMSRKGSCENCRNIMETAKMIGANIILGSDAHICFDVGNFEKVHEHVESVGMPKELIMNLIPDNFRRYLKEKGKISDI